MWKWVKCHSTAPDYKHILTPYNKQEISLYIFAALVYLLITQSLISFKDELLSVVYYCVINALTKSISHSIYLYIVYKLFIWTDHTAWRLSKLLSSCIPDQVNTLSFLPVWMTVRGKKHFVISFILDYKELVLSCIYRTCITKTTGNVHIICTDIYICIHTFISK